MAAASLPEAVPFPSLVSSIRLGRVIVGRETDRDNFLGFSTGPRYFQSSYSTRIVVQRCGTGEW